MEFIQRIIAEYPIIYSEDSESGGSGFGSGFSERWGWYHSFIRIAREHKIRVKDVGRENLHESLTLLSYLIDEEKEQARQLKKITK